VTAISKKICLLGDFAVGKTSLVRRFVYSRFDDKYVSTIGVKVSRKTVVVSRDHNAVELAMMLWDLAGSEEFDQVRASYMRGTAGAVLVCDLTRPETLASLSGYAQDLRKVNSNIQLVIAANKQDLTDQHQVTPAQVRRVADALSVPRFFTSAKTGEEVEMLFRYLGRLLVMT
jgi:small GTP-binding protein